jgi:hypothetical protein
MLDIRIHEEREMAPIYVMGHVDPLTFTRGRRHQTITIEATEEDGNGTIHMENEQQLYRLYERLHEYYHPRILNTVQFDGTTIHAAGGGGGAARGLQGRTDIVDNVGARERIGAIQTAMREEPLWARTYVTPFPIDQPMEYVPAQRAEGQVFTREDLNRAHEQMLNTPIVPTQYFVQEDQYRDLITEPLPITITCTIADDPADQESILEFMEK